MQLASLLSVLTGYRFYLFLIDNDCNTKFLCSDYLNRKLWTDKTINVVREYCMLYVYNVKSDKGVIHITLSENRMLCGNLYFDFLEELIPTQEIQGDEKLPFY